MSPATVAAWAAVIALVVVLACFVAVVVKGTIKQIKEKGNR